MNRGLHRLDEITTKNKKELKTKPQELQAAERNAENFAPGFTYTHFLHF